MRSRVPVPPGVDAAPAEALSPPPARKAMRPPSVTPPAPARSAGAAEPRRSEAKSSPKAASKPGPLPPPAPPPAAAAAPPPPAAVSASPAPVPRAQLALDPTAVVRIERQVQPPAEDEVLRAEEFLRRADAELSTKLHGASRARVRFECGRLCEAVLHRPDEAISQYRKALVDNGSHVPSIRALRRLLLTKGDFGAAVPLFDAQIAATRSATTRAALLYEKGRVLEDRLGQRREGREAFVAALELNPGDAALLKAVLRAELGARAWDSLDKTIEHSAAAVKSDSRHRAALLVERARIAESRRKNLPQAAELYQAALDADPRSDAAVHALKRLHYSHQRWRDLVGVLEREAEQVADPNARAMALYRVGRIEIDKLGNPEQGAHAFERALGVVKDDRLVLEALARAYESMQNHAALGNVLSRLSELSRSDAERIAYLTRGAQLYEDQLQDDATAIAWYEKALSLDRAHAPALAALSRLYGRTQNWESLLAICAGEAEAARDAHRRAYAHARMAEILEKQLGKPELALAHHARALGIVPGYSASFKALVRLYSAANKHAELVELYERAVDLAHDAETKTTYLFKIGRVHEDTLGDPRAALATYRRILGIDAGHLGAVHAAERAAERGGLYRELTAMLELEAKLVKDPKERLMLLHRAGEVAEHELGDDALALGLQRRVLELDAKFGPALASLGRLYYRAGRWEELVHVYQAELSSMPRGPESARLDHKIGEIYELRIAKDDLALAAYRRALEADPKHLPARRALERKLAEKQHFEEISKLIENELSTETDPLAIARAALRLGEVLEHRMNAGERALGAYERALAADPQFRPARDARVRLLTEARDWKRLVDELAREAEASADPKLAIAALLRAGEIWQTELGAAQKAIECFEAVLEKDPGHIDALLSLEGLYAERSLWEPLSRVYATEARVFSEPAARIAALSELGRLEETKGVGSDDERKAAYFAILQLAPNDQAALSALERLALENDDGSLLAHVDAKQAALAEDPEVRAAHLTRLAEALERAGDPSALGVWRSAIAADPESLSAARGITRLADRRAEPALLEEASQHETRVTGDLDVAARLLVRAAVLTSEAGNVEGAIRLLSRALEQHPDFEAAAGKLFELLVARGAVDDLISQLTNAANSASVPSRIAALWSMVSDLYAARKNDVPAALAALHRAQSLAPGHAGTLIKLAELYSADRQWAEAVDRLKQALAHATSDEMRVDVQLRLAAILQDELGDSERALASLNSALALDAGSRLALSRLARLELARGRGDQAAELAQRLVRVSPELGERVEALTLLGDLEAGRGQHAAAVQAYEQAVTLSGLAGKAAERFRALTSEQARRKEPPSFARYAAALKGYAEQHPAAGAALTALYVELARVLGDDLAQPDQAAQALEKGLLGAPQDAELLAAYGHRLLDAQRFADAAQAFRRAIALDVFRPEVFRGLAEAWRRLGRGAESACAAGAVVALGAGNDLELSALSSRVVRAAAQAPSSLDASVLASIDVNPADSTPSALLAALADTAGKVFTPDFERWGLNAREKISAKSGHPLRALAERVAAVFGVESFDLYVHRASAATVHVELSDPVSLLVPASVAGLPEPAAVFALARCFASIARGLAPIERLTEQELRLLLGGAARGEDPSFGAGQPDEEALGAIQRRVTKALPWLGRGAIEEAARAYAASPPADLGEWLLAARTTSARAAALVCDDIVTAAEGLRRSESDPGSARARRLLGDVLAFWVSDGAFSVKRRLGMG
jgi:cellulose synthase operon protein C